MSEFAKKFNPYKVILTGTDGLLWQDFLAVNPAELFE